MNRTDRKKLQNKRHSELRREVVPANAGRIIPPQKRERFRLQKIFSSAELVLVRKDLASIWRRRGVRALLIALPLFLVVVLPIILFLVISLLPTSAMTEQPQVLLQLLSLQKGELAPRAFWTTVVTMLLCPMLYLCVPIVCAVSAAACSFVSEKESGTLETLFLSSMRAKSIFNAKVTACSLISILISWVAFLAFVITATVADLLISAPFFLNFSWLLIAVFLAPALSLFSSVFVTLLLPRVHNTPEALQTMGYLLLPILLLYLLQLTGAFRVSLLFLVFSAVIIAILAVILFNLSAGKFHAEVLSDSEIDT